jgi:hypothetical protein
LNFDYVDATGDFVITYLTGPSLSVVGRAQVAESALQVTDTIAGEDWHPLGARAAGSATELVVYGVNPATTVAGFYRKSPGMALQDSLVVAINLSPTDGMGFEVSGDNLYFGLTTGSYGAAKMLLLCKDMSNGSDPTVLAHLSGGFVSVGINNVGTCAVVSRYVWSDGETLPGNRVDIINLLTGEHHSVDVRTRPCGFVAADFAGWNPNGDAIVFSGSGFDGEVGATPRELWIRTATGCP